jgi:UMF1 family MFS transporter
MQTTSKKERIGWYFYDWANSAFYTIVITVFLGPYLSSIALNAADSEKNVYILSIPIYAESLFVYTISFSVILQFFLLPYLGSIADYTKSKKLLLGFFAFLGSFSTMGLYFLEGSNYLLGSILLVIANVSFGASVVVYNSFLNDIAEAKDRDKVSSIGWALGYIGGGIILLINILLYSNADNFNISGSYAIRIGLFSAGFWWAVFTLIPLKLLKDRKNSLDHGDQSVFVGGIKGLLSSIKDIIKHPQTLLFLIAYLFYNDGIQAVIAVSGQFAKFEIGMDISSITKIILMVQFIAFFGSLLFMIVAKKTDTKSSIFISLIIWIGVIFYCFYFLSTEMEFFILAMVIALVLGGSQALSRSLFSNLIPKGEEARYFSFYEVSDRGTSWLGPFLFGYGLQLTHSYRYAILSLLIFFIVGLILLLFLNQKKGMESAGNLQN